MLKVINSLQEARAKGLKRYFTGKPCPKGHVCDRMVTNTDCVDCMRIRSDARYKTDPEYREKVKIKRRNYYVDDPQKYRDRAKADYLKNPENYRANAANRVARLKGIHGHISGQDIYMFSALQNYECKYCNCSLVEYYEVDHAMALSQGGPNTIGNIQCLCEQCHKNKTIHDVRLSKQRKKSG